MFATRQWLGHIQDGTRIVLNGLISTFGACINNTYFFQLRFAIKMIRGTNHDQDARFTDKTKKMLEKSQWPDKYDIKIDLKKVDYELIKVWIEKRITKLLGEEDDIVSGTIISHLDEHLQKEEKINAKVFHVAISAVLQDKTLTFVSQLWDILDEAQRSSRGIPECLVEAKKKSEDSHRRKLHEMQQKRHKLNVNRFSQSMRGEGYSRSKYDYKASEERQGKRERSQQFAQKGKRHKEKRSRSKSAHKKRRNRSAEKKRERSRERSSRHEKKRSEHRNRQKSPRFKGSKRQKRSPSSQSDSSGVVSSSSSSN